MTDAKRYADSIQFPKGATEESVLKLKVSELKRIVQLAYIKGSRDELETQSKRTASPDFGVFNEIFGGKSR